jgi:hypothetical protein
MLFCGIWYPAGLCSAGYDTPQDFVLRGLIPRRTLLSGYQTLHDIVLRGIRPHRKSVCYKMYTTLPLFCWVWYPARLSSAGSDTENEILVANFSLNFRSVPKVTGKGLSRLFIRHSVAAKLMKPKLRICMNSRNVGQADLLTQLHFDLKLKAFFKPFCGNVIFMRGRKAKRVGT